MTLPILTSPKLTELTHKRAALSAKAKASQAEVTRLSKLQHASSWIEATVVRVTDVDAPTATLIGIKPRPDQASVVTTGMGDTEEAARKNDILFKTLAGETLTSTLSIGDQLSKEQEQWAAYELAIEFLDRKIYNERNRLGAEYCKSFTPLHIEQMVKLCKTLLDVYAAWSDVSLTRRELIDSSVGTRGLYSTLPDFLPNHADPYSPMADFFVAAKRQGWIKEVPASLRMKAPK